MGYESALREQRLEHVREVDRSIPSDAIFVPFADVIDDLDWTPDVNMDQRRGIGHPDIQKFDRGTETHSISFTHSLQGSIALATATEANAGHVLDAIVRKASRQLYRRTLIQREYHPGQGVEGQGRYMYSVARHALPDTLTLSGDPENNSPIETSIDFMAPKARSFVLDQPDRTDWIVISSTESESLDIKIRGVNGVGTEVTETLTMTGGFAETTAEFEEILEVEALEDHAGDLEVVRRSTGLITDYDWESSGTGTAEFYLQAPGGGDPGINQPNRVYEGGATMSPGTLGTLSAGEWAWGDNDTLGYDTLYVRLGDDSDPDTKSENYVEADNNYQLNPVLMTMYGNIEYNGIEGDLGIPVLPASGERKIGHGGTEQRFLPNTVNWRTNPIAEKLNTGELEVANNPESQSAANQLGQVIEAGPRDITFTASVFGKTESHQKIDSALRKLVGDVVWNMDLNTLTLENSTVTDPEGRQRSDGDVFAVKDVEWTAKSITVA